MSDRSSARLLFVALLLSASTGVLPADGTHTLSAPQGFAARGGMVNFTVEESKVRFEINEDAARRAGLKISSKLLRLAELVEEAGPEVGSSARARSI